MKRKLKPRGGGPSKGAALNVSISIAHRINKRIRAKFDAMVCETERELVKLFERDDFAVSYAMDENIGAQARMLMGRLWRKFKKMFRELSYPVTREMLDLAEKDSAATLKASLAGIVDSLTIPVDAITPHLKEVIAASSARNVALIKRVPSEYLGPIETAVYQSISTGRGLADLKPTLERQGVKVRNWAHNVSMDQTRKVYNDISAARMQSVGVDEYEWVHSGGSNNPRVYHRDVLHGKRCSLSNPPVIDPKTKQRGHPATLPFCRCRMRPLVSFKPKEAAT